MVIQRQALPAHHYGRNQQRTTPIPCKEQPSHFTVQFVNMTIKRLGDNTQIIQTDNDLNILTLGKTGIPPLDLLLRELGLTTKGLQNTREGQTDPQKRQQMLLSPLPSTLIKILLKQMRRSPTPLTDSPTNIRVVSPH